MATRVRIHEPGVIALQAEMDQKLSRPLTEAIARDMRRYVPVDTWALHHSIRTEHPGPGHGRVWFGDVAAGVDYHLYQEYGTSRMSAQPYARPAVYQRRDAL